MDYYLKYLKYKNKYLSLRNQIGGSKNFNIVDTSNNIISPESWDVMYILASSDANDMFGDCSNNIISDNFKNIDTKLKGKKGLIIKVENELIPDETATDETIRNISFVNIITSDQIIYPVGKKKDIELNTKILVENIIHEFNDESKEIPFHNSLDTAIFLNKGWGKSNTCIRRKTFQKLA